MNENEHKWDEARDESEAKDAKIAELKRALRQRKADYELVLQAGQKLNVDNDKKNQRIAEMAALLDRVKHETYAGEAYKSIVHDKNCPACAWAAKKKEWGLTSEAQQRQGEAT